MKIFMLAIVRIFLGISLEKKGRKTVLAGLTEEYPLDIPDSLRGSPVSSQLVPFFFLFSTDVSRNILMLVRALILQPK